MKPSDLSRKLFNLLLTEEFENAERLWKDNPSLQDLQTGFDVAQDLVQVDMPEKQLALKWMLEHYPKLATYQPQEDYVDGVTLLHWAITCVGNPEFEPSVFALLLAHGTQLEAPIIQSLKEDPLAQIYGSISMVGATPLLTCAKSGNAVLLKELLAHPINRWAKTAAGEDFLDVLVAWEGRIAQQIMEPNECLRLWIADAEGLKMMTLKCQDPIHRQTLLKHFPEVTQAFIAKEESDTLRAVLPSAPTLTPKTKL